MKSQDEPPRDWVARLPLLFAVGVLAMGAWAAWLTSSWVVLAAAAAVAFVPARTYAGDVRSWARRRQRGGS